MSFEIGAPASAKSYFERRLSELGINKADAAAHGLKPDGQGNILQICRAFNGSPITWIDRRGANARKIAALENRKTFTENGGGLERYAKELSVLRYSPEALAADSALPKYRFPSKDVTGYSPPPMPSNTAIEAYRGGKVGGVAFGVEGYFKACALAAQGVEATAWGGIAMYKVCTALKDYLAARQLADFVILYDADALEIRPDADGILSSRRAEAFFASAANFARAFHDFCRAAGLHTRLHFAMGEGAKGVDDALAEADAAGKTRIIAALQSLKESAFFSFARLGSTTWEARLNHIFAHSSHVNFYDRYAEAIGSRPFKFYGVTYQTAAPGSQYDLLAYQAGRRYFQMKNDPFRVEADAVGITVNRYLAEADAALESLIEANARLCIAAPTGSGKTAFWLGYTEGKRKRKGYFERKRCFGVLAVPTVMLAKQLSAAHNIPALYGHVTAKQRQAALNARAVVCTYDTLRHVTDRHRRTLVIDEAHNLVNQYGEVKANKPFRADVLRRMVAMFDSFERTALISATPPRLFAAHSGFALVEIQRRENNLAHVHALEADSSSPQALAAALIAELGKLDFSADAVHLVYYNSTEQLELVADHLAANGICPRKEIAIITRAHVDAGKEPVYDGIIHNERIEGAKLVLSTCLIAEGVNIKNENIGNIYTVGINCPDSFLQYVARFRAMPRLDVYSIRPPERKIGKGFLFPAAVELAELEKLAEAQRQILVNSIATQTEDYPDDVLPFWDEIRPGYAFKPHYVDYVYQDGKTAHVDRLRLFATIRERMLDESNNCYFYTQIERFPNIRLEGAADADAAGRADATTALKATADDAALEKKAVLAALADAIAERPAAVVGAYHAKAAATGNRHATAQIEALAGGLLDDPAGAEQFASEALAEYFTRKFLSKAIMRACRLFFAGLTAKDTAAWVLRPEGEFSAVWRHFCTVMELAVYDDRNTRQRLTAHHRAEIRIKKLMQAWITELAEESGKVDSKSLTAMLNAKFRRLALNESLDGVQQQQVIRFDAARAESTLKALFAVTSEAAQGRGKVFEIEPIPDAPLMGASCEKEHFLAYLLGASRTSQPLKGL